MPQARQPDGALAQVPVAVPPGIAGDPGIVEVDDLDRVQSRSPGQVRQQPVDPRRKAQVIPGPWAWAVSRHNPRGTPLRVMMRSRCSKHQPSSRP